MPSKRVEVVPGQRYGRLEVIREVAIRRSAGYTKRYVLCRCDCGSEVETRLSHLRSGHTAGCGKCSCVVRAASCPEHGVWKGMKKRCYHAGQAGYDNYGARGIRVCDRWLHSFAAFYEDMGPRPSPEHQIDRIDGDGDYEPGNCRWATRAQQNRHRRDNRFLEFRGERLCLSDWAKRFGMRKGTLHYRLKRGLSVEEALTTPVRQWRTDDKFQMVPISKRDAAWYREYARRAEVAGSV